MAIKLKRWVRKTFIFCNAAVVLFYLLALLTPFFNTAGFWFIALLGLIFPFLFLLLTIGMIICLIIRSKWYFVSIAAILLGWQQIFAAFGFHFSKEFNAVKSSKAIRVLAWNVSRWDEQNRQIRAIPYREMMFDFVQQQNADVLCLQEFFECRDPKFFQENIPELEKMGYRYHYFFPSFSRFERKFEIGLMIASKYPILDSASFANQSGEHSEGLCYADIKIEGQVFRFYSTHLESAGFNREDYALMGSFHGWRTVAGKIRRSYALRNAQALMVRNEVAKSPYPSVLCCDLDDVPNSYAYFTVKGNLQDAFLKKEFGLGRTFRFISPTLRIDYIFADKRCKIDQFTKLTVPYSDHYPLVADLSLKGN